MSTTLINRSLACWLRRVSNQYQQRWQVSHSRLNENEWIIHLKKLQSHLPFISFQQTHRWFFQSWNESRKYAVPHFFYTLFTLQTHEYNVLNELHLRLHNIKRNLRRIENIPRRRNRRYESVHVQTRERPMSSDGTATRAATFVLAFRKISAAST